METPAKSSERKPSASLPKALLAWLLILAAVVGIQGVARGLVSFWFILLPLLFGMVWVGLVAFADHLVSQGRYDQALRLVSLLSMGGGGRSYLRGDVLTDAGRYEEAERMLRKAIDRNSVDKDFALEALGNVLMDTGRFEEAQQCFRGAAGIDPNNSLWATGMAEALLRQEIYPQPALTHAERALNLFRSGSERIGARSRLGAILATKAWALAACGREAEAREAIEEALKSPARKTKGPLAQVHYKAGMSLLALSDHPGAKEHFARGAQLDPAGRWGRLCAGALS
jgi:tetratricopeptide (TPR) repeat protein